MGTTQLRKGVIELAILALLSREAMYGGQIIATLESHPGLNSGAGTVYPLLTRLAKAKLVSTRWEESTSGPPRKYYELTPAGQTFLASSRNEWAAVVSAMNEVLS